MRYGAIRWLLSLSYPLVQRTDTHAFLAPALVGVFSSIRSGKTILRTTTTARLVVDRDPRRTPTAEAAAMARPRQRLRKVATTVAAATTMAPPPPKAAMTRALVAIAGMAMGAVAPLLPPRARITMTTIPAAEVATIKPARVATRARRPVSPPAPAPAAVTIRPRAVVAAQ